MGSGAGFPRRGSRALVPDMAGGRPGTLPRHRWRHLTPAIACKYGGTHWIAYPITRIMRTQDAPEIYRARSNSRLPP